MLHGEVIGVGEQVVVATVYNTCTSLRMPASAEHRHRRLKAFFDTNVSNHNHFFVEDRGN